MPKKDEKPSANLLMAEKSDSKKVCPFCGESMKLLRKDVGLYKCVGCGFLARFEK